jgi:hypothetical protein
MQHHLQDALAIRLLSGSVDAKKACNGARSARSGSSARAVRWVSLL